MLAKDQCSLAFERAGLDCGVDVAGFGESANEFGCATEPNLSHTQKRYRRRPIAQRGSRRPRALRDCVDGLRPDERVMQETPRRTVRRTTDRERRMAESPPQDELPPRRRVPLWIALTAVGVALLVGGAIVAIVAVIRRDDLDVTSVAC